MGLAERYPVRYTVKDWERWEGDWELVEGVPYAMASPRPINQLVLVKVARLLDEAIQRCESCKAYAELDWYISSDTVVRPDLMVLCGDIPERVEKAPSLIVEIVSPSSKLMDEGLKRELYQREGVPYYVLVYPEEKRVVCLELREKLYREKADGLFSIEGCKIELSFEEALR